MPITLARDMFAGLLLFISSLLAVDAMSCDEKNVCVLEGSSVNMSCNFSNDDVNLLSDISNLFWFNNDNKKKWKDKTIPEDLTDDRAYSGRFKWLFDVSGRFIKHNASFSITKTLQVKDLRKSDTAVYRVMVPSENSGWKFIKTGITVTVTALKVTKYTTTVNNRQKVTLTCSTTCTLSDNLKPNYIWYKNGQQLTNPKTLNVNLYLDPVSSQDAGSYICAVKDSEKLHSPALCLLGNCWDVTHQHKTICAFAGTNIELRCNYTYPSNQTITDTIWSKSGVKYLDNDRIEYRGKKENDCTLRITDLRESDSGYYTFSLETQGVPKYSDPFGVNLSVTNLQVEVTPPVANEGDLVIISCMTSCPNFSDLLLYKNNVSATGKSKTMILDAVSSKDAGRYFCVVRGFEDFPSLAATLVVRYGPKNTSVSVSGEIDEGSLVTLTCSSDANPPVKSYTWYMRNGTEVSVLQTGAGRDKYIIPNVSLGDKTQYYCRAENKMGAQNSTALDLNTGVFFPVSVLASVLGVVGVVLAAKASVLIYCTLKRRRTAGSGVRGGRGVRPCSCVRGESGVRGGRGVREESGVRGGCDVRGGSGVRGVCDVRGGSGVRGGCDVRGGSGVRVGCNVRGGSGVRGGRGVREESGVRGGCDVRAGSGSREGCDVRADTQTIYYANKDSSNSDVSETTSACIYETIDDMHLDPDEYNDIQDDDYTSLQRDACPSLYDTIPKKASPQDLE
ncbi:B-cell receptor CD22 [Oncorhynchus tshawytscha]|uniref:B-cell receptor CD22 n=1 Tax=Oncorhynchus tshawytscha TaxID=74940 RepID=UPI000D099B48|nr:B-cell receptor CD22 [Oncorhynchus tshawytscha]